MLADGELTSGAVVEVIGAEFGISQSAVSQHLAVLRESGFATVRPDGARRIYALEAGPLWLIDRWRDLFRLVWGHRIDRVCTELARGKGARRNQDGDWP